jgi:hypothetical protein
MAGLIFLPAAAAGALTLASVGGAVLAAFPLAVGTATVGALAVRAACGRGPASENQVICAGTVCVGALAISNPMAAAVTVVGLAVVDDTLALEGGLPGAAAARLATARRAWARGRIRRSTKQTGALEATCPESVAAAHLLADAAEAEDFCLLGAPAGPDSSFGEPSLAAACTAGPEREHWPLLLLPLKPFLAALWPHG